MFPHQGPRTFEIFFKYWSGTRSLGNVLMSKKTHFGNFGRVRIIRQTSWFSYWGKSQTSRATGQLLNDTTRYCRLVGKLIYLTITRPELTYVVHILSQLMQSPKTEHMQAACRVLRCLKGSTEEGIVLKANNNLQLFGFCDSDWAACPLSRRSLTRYFATLGGSPIS